MSTETHEDVPTLPTKTNLTVMCDHTYGSSIHQEIYVPQFHYYGIHTLGPEFDEDLLMTIGKKWDEEENNEFHNTFYNQEGFLKGRVTESRISQIKTL